MPPPRASQPSHASVWIATAERPEHPALPGDTQTDVVVVGGGITGLTAALLLQREGRRVIVLESHRVGDGTSGHTTGKVTSQHGLTYAQLVRERGEDVARAYGAANEAGVALVAELVDATGADCAAVRAPAYVYTAERSEVSSIEEEARVAAGLGLPSTLADPAEVALPGVLAAVRFDDQLHFHAQRYLDALAAAVVAGGGAVYEHSRVHGVEERPDHVVARTDRGHVRAEHAVVATLLPITDTGGFFARARASRAYGLAARIADPDRVGMYISAEQPTRSTRPWHHDDGVGVVVVGEEHVTGAEDDTDELYQALERWARDTFDVVSVDYRWSAQDYTSIDHVPYIGRSPRRRRTWVATGFRKWGLSAGTVGAQVISDLVAGRDSPWRELFDPGRVGGPTAVGRLLKENAGVAGHFVGDWLGRLRAGSVADLAPGTGGVVRDGGRVFGAYRDPEGGVHGVSLTCTHVGCTLRWNPAETTWDCPCHGSRFGHDGTVLQGPATRDLRRIDVK